MLSSPVYNFVAHGYCNRQMRHDRRTEQLMMWQDVRVKTEIVYCGHVISYDACRGPVKIYRD